MQGATHQACFSAVISNTNAYHKKTHPTAPLHGNNCPPPSPCPTPRENVPQGTAGVSSQNHRLGPADLPVCGVANTRGRDGMSHGDRAASNLVFLSEMSRGAAHSDEQSRLPQNHTTVGSTQGSPVILGRRGLGKQ